MDEKSYLDDLPQRDAAHDIEKAAINAFENAITEAGLFVVQQRNDTNDYGTDIQIEARIGASMTNFRVHVQLKGTECKENSDGSVSISIDRKNLNYLVRQPHSIYVCYHLPSKRLLVQTADDTLQQYEQKSSNWRTQKYITIKFKEYFSVVFQNKLHSLVMTDGKFFMEQRFQCITTSPKQLNKILNTVSSPIYLSGEPQRAYQILVEMFKAGQYDKISDSFPKFDAVLGKYPEAIALAYMAEINLGIDENRFDVKRVQKAIPLFEALRSKQGHQQGDLTYCIGNAYSILQDYQNALSSYLQAITEFSLPEDAHEDAMCYKNIGAVHKSLGNSTDERKSYEKSLELDPYLPEAHFAMGVCLYTEGKYQPALEHLDKIIWDVDSLSRSLSVNAWRIPILFNLKDSAGAFREINTLLSHVRMFEWILPWCGKFVSQFGKESIESIQKSLLFWKKYLRDFPEDTKGKYEYLICSWLLHEEDFPVDLNFESFKREMLELMDSGTIDSAFLWDRIGHWAQTDGLWERAEDAYRKACQQEPDEYGYCLGVVLNHLGKYAEALSILLPQAEIHQPDELSWYQVARAYEGLGNIEGCRKAYKKAIKINPDYTEVWFEFGGSLWNLGDRDMAFKIWENAIARFPKHESVKIVEQFFAGEGPAFGGVKQRDTD